MISNIEPTFFRTTGVLSTLFLGKEPWQFQKSKKKLAVPTSRLIWFFKFLSPFQIVWLPQLFCHSLHGNFWFSTSVWHFISIELDTHIRILLVQLFQLFLIFLNSLCFRTHNSSKFQASFFPPSLQWKELQFLNKKISCRLIYFVLA